MKCSSGANFKIFNTRREAEDYLSEDIPAISPRTYSHNPLGPCAESISDTIASPTSVVNKLGEWVSNLEMDRADIAQALEISRAQNEELRDELATIKRQVKEINEVVMRLQAEHKLAKG